MTSDHFFIAGAQKCGTSTLHASLASHPDVVPAVDPSTGKWVKEMHYFCDHWDRGFDWYASHYRTSRKHTLDATPNYLCDPQSIVRIAKVFPSAKFVVSLRDPVLRAISQHNHYSMIIPESLDWDWRSPGESFDDNVNAESQNPFPSWWGLIGRGLYAEQLEHLAEFVSRDRIHVVIMEEWVNNPQQVCQEILRFLGLNPHDLTIQVCHQREHTAIAPTASVLTDLHEYYRDPNEKLFGWLGREIPQWTSQGFALRVSEIRKAEND